jgi:RecA-family ATPase
MMFPFEAAAIRPEDLEIGKTEYLIGDFLVAEAITMIYGAASQGKTWFMYAVAKLLAGLEEVKRVYYIDMDNPKRQLVDRGVDRLLLVHEKVAYLTKASAKVSPPELVASIEAEAYGRRYEGVVFIFDSTRDFVADTRNDSQAKRFMERMKSLREAGATVLLIHHATKNGRVIDGSVEFVRSADNVYELKQKLRSGSKIHYALKVENDRDPIKDMAFCVDTQSYSLEVEDDAFVTIDPQEEAFVKRVLSILGTAAMGQGEILAALGKRRDDKTARRLFDKYTGRFWESRMDGRRKLYYAL